MKSLNIKEFKKVGGDEHHTILKSPKGHEIKVLHKPLAKHHAEALRSLPVAKMADGGEVDNSTFRNMAQKYFGDDPAQGDEITPTGSPIDLIAGGIGAGMGRAMAGDAASVAANEVGAVGPSVKSAAYMPNMTQQAVNDAIPTGEGMASNAAGTAAKQAADTQAKGRAADFAQRLAKQKASSRYANGGRVQRFADGGMPDAPAPAAPDPGVDPTLQANGMPVDQGQPQAPALDQATIQKREIYNQAATSPAYGLQPFGADGAAPADFNANVWNDVVEPGYADKAAKESAAAAQVNEQSAAENKARASAGLPPQASPANGNPTPAQQSQQAPGQGPPAAGTGAPSDPYGAIASSQAFTQGLQGQIDATQAAGQHDADAIKAQAAASNSAAAAINKNLQLGKAQMAAIDKDSQDYMHDLWNGHIDPKRLVNNMDTGQKIATGIGMLLSGMGSGITGQPNLAVEYINKQIQNDIEAQKSDLGRKENLLSVNLKRYGNVKDATEMTSAQLKAAAAYQISAAGANSSAAAVKDRANALANSYLKDAATGVGQMAQRRSIQAATPGSVPPEQFIRSFLPENEKPAALKELKDAQDAVNLRDNALSAFDQMSKLNTLKNNIMSPIQTKAQIQALSGPILDKITHDTSGRVNEHSLKLIGDAFSPSAFQSQQTKDVARRQLNTLMTQGMNYPTLKQWNLDPLHNSRYTPDGTSKITVMPPALQK